MPIPKISVVMSVYNFNRNPMRGIETILIQSMSDFEFIIVNDGSNEQTTGILERYAKKDNRIILLTNDKRLRLASSLNKAIRESHSQYIARADVNISYHPERLQKQFEFMEENHDIDILGSNFYWATDGMDGKKEVMLPEKHEQIAKRLSYICCMCHPSIMYKHNKLIPFGPYKENYGWAEDYNLWMRVRNKLIFHNMQEFLLTKWHRKEPWKNRYDLTRFQYFKGDILSRIEGFSTSPCLWLDFTCLPTTFFCFIAGTRIHKILRYFKKAIPGNVYNEYIGAKLK